MKNQTGIGYLSSAVFPALALLVLALRLGSPHTRLLAAGLYVCGCVGLVLALRSHAKLRRRLEQAKSQAVEQLQTWGLLRKRALLSGAIFALSLIAFPWLMPLDRLGGFRTSKQQFVEQLQLDRLQLTQAQQQLPQAEHALVQAARQLRIDDHQSRDRLKRAWVDYAELESAIAGSFDSQRYFFHIAAQDHALADLGFLCAYDALVDDLKSAQAVLAAVGSAPGAEVILNEAAPELGLPAGSYQSFARGVTQPAQLLRLQAGALYLRTLLTLKPQLNDVSDRTIADATGAITKRGQRTPQQLLERAESTLRNLGSEPHGLIDTPFDLLESRVQEAWLPLQRGAAQTISPVRTKHRENFITDEQLLRAHQLLRSGDILVERRNWYLTNIGIPGFWPHAALYLGSLDELDATFTGADRSLSDGLAPSEYIRLHYPEAFAALSRPDAAGHMPRVIEAIGEGVVVQSLEHSGKADYMAALRPRLSSSERFAAVLVALKYFGRPYDYDFEFTTDDTVVCSELVYKALAPSQHNSGIHFSLVEQNGRLLLPPNDIVRAFDQSYDGDERELDFVFFLDGREKNAAAHFSDIVALRSSWQRPKWDVVQR